MHPLEDRLALFLSAAALFCLAGCSQVLDIPDDPQLVPTSSGEPWGCLGRAPVATSPDADAALVRMQACNFVSPKCSEPVTGFAAKLCGKLDIGCSNPIQLSVREINGALEFAVPTGGVLGVGFDGYIELTPPEANCTSQEAFGDVGPLLCALRGPNCDSSVPDDPDCNFPLFVPSLYFFNPPVKTDVETPIPIPLVPTRAAQQLIAASGGNFNPTTGIVFTTSLDCNGVPAPDVALTIDKHQDVVTELYSENGVISSTAKVTDESGLGGYIGVPAGFVVVNAFLGTDEPGSQRVGEVGVNVEAFTISYTSLVPSE